MLSLAIGIAQSVPTGSSPTLCVCIYIYIYREIFIIIIIIIISISIIIVIYHAIIIIINKVTAVAGQASKDEKFMRYYTEEQPRGRGDWAALASPADLS